MNKRRSLHDLLQSVGAFVTLFIFLTGLSSLPEMFGRPERSQGLASGSSIGYGFGVLDAFSSEIQIAIAMLSLPLFCVVNTWFLASVSKAFLASLDYLEINAAISDYLFKGLVLLPVALGLNMVLMTILFGTYLDWLPAVLGLSGLAVTVLLIWKPETLLQTLKTPRNSGQRRMLHKSDHSRPRKGKS